MSRLPDLYGGALALLAAALFGISMPLVQLFGAGLGAFTTAALLYAGAAAVGELSRHGMTTDILITHTRPCRTARTAICSDMKACATHTRMCRTRIIRIVTELKTG